MRAYQGKGVRIFCDVVREPVADCDLEGSRVASARFVARAFRAMQSSGRIPSSRESFVSFALDSRHRVIGVTIAGMGTVDGAPAMPREVFRAAIVANARVIVVAHNHPSGDVSPSNSDRGVTERLRQCGELVGIEVLDHVIVGADRFYSFAEDREAIDGRCER